MRAHSEPGPPARIEAYGAVTRVKSRALLPDVDATQRVAFDITASPTEATTINPGLEKLARYVNLYAAAGLDAQRAQLVAVLHGDATYAAMNDEAYRQKFRAPNPNAELLHKLREAGFEIHVCGQAMDSRQIEPKQLDRNVDVVLSALTALTALAHDGYYVERIFG